MGRDDVVVVVDERSLHEQLLHPYESFTALRQAPGYNAEARLWEVFDYDAVHTVASEYECFSSDESKFLSSSEWPVLKSMLNTDPPRHRQLRSLVSQAFTPRAIAQLASRIASITHELLDRVVQAGTMDVIQDLSYPLPVIVIAEMLGVPSEDRPQFKRWSDEIVSGEYDEFTGENREEIARKIRARVRHTIDEIDDYFRHIIAHRRRKPGDDLISALLAAQIDGEYLTERELLGFCALLLVAGNITTTNLIGNAILCFDEHPEVMEQLRLQPDLMPGAIEEVLRYRSPITVVGRFATSDLMLGGHRIEKGQFVLGWVACANYDPAQFPRPEHFDIQRNPNRHLSFGHGIHFCLGAPLARLETRIALTIMLERLRDIRRVHEDNLEPVSSSFIYGAKHIPVTFSRT
jgi:cytochrome P450